MLNDSSATEVEVPVTGAAAEGSLQEASGKILQNIFNEDVVNLDDVPTTPPDEKDYMVETKELSHQKNIPLKYDGKDMHITVTKETKEEREALKVT